LTIKNTATSQAYSLFRVAGVFISFPLARAALLLLRQKYQKTSLREYDPRPKGPRPGFSVTGALLPVYHYRPFLVLLVNDSEYNQSARQ
jgi:hypothetical protein